MSEKDVHLRVAEWITDEDQTLARHHSHQLGHDAYAQLIKDKPDDDRVLIRRGFVIGYLSRAAMSNEDDRLREKDIEILTGFTPWSFVRAVAAATVYLFAVQAVVLIVVGIVLKLLERMIN